MRSDQLHECPFGVITGSPARASECPLLGVKRKSNSGSWMSAFSQKRKFASQPIPRETNQISHIMMPVDGAVHRITSGLPRHAQMPVILRTWPRFARSVPSVMSTQHGIPQFFEGLTNNCLLAAATGLKKTRRSQWHTRGSQNAHVWSQVIHRRSCHGRVGAGTGSMWSRLKRSR